MCMWRKAFSAVAPRARTLSSVGRSGQSCLNRLVTLLLAMAGGSVVVRRPYRVWQVAMVLVVPRGLTRVNSWCWRISVALLLLAGPRSAVPCVVMSLTLVTWSVRKLPLLVQVLEVCLLPFIVKEKMSEIPGEDLIVPTSEARNVVSRLCLLRGSLWIPCKQTVGLLRRTRAGRPLNSLPSALVLGVIVRLLSVCMCLKLLPLVKVQVTLF